MKTLSDLRILPIGTAKDKRHPNVAHPYLPQHEFTMVVTAPKGSGKTTMICNLLLKHYKSYFNKIYVFSPTVDNDDKWDVIKKTKGIQVENKRKDGHGSDDDDGSKDIKEKAKEVHKTIVFKSDMEMQRYYFDTINKKKPSNYGGSHKSKKDKEESDEEACKSNGRIPKKCFISNFDEEDLKKVLKAQQKEISRIRKEGKPIGHSDRLLLIFDDMVGSNLFKQTRKDNIFKELNVRHRHFNTSLIMVTQAYKEIPKTFRTNASCHAIFGISNQSELDVIYEENPMGMRNKDAWMRMFEQITKPAHSFMLINYQKGKGEQVYRNFEKMIHVNAGAKKEIHPEDEEYDDDTDVEMSVEE